MFINGRERISVTEVATEPTDDYVLLYCQFLDDFRHESDEGKSGLIASAPKCLNDRPDYYDAFLAGVCETLAKESNIDIPGWIYEDRYYLDSPTFPDGTERVPGFQEFLRETTPIEFAARNVLFGDNLMKRC